MQLKSTGKISSALLNKDIQTFQEVIQYTHQLPYGRVDLQNNLANVLVHGKGTCSTKHAFLKAVADEQNIASQLFIRMFAMHAGNTPEIEHLLKQYNIDFIPEAHCYFQYQTNTIDITFGHNPPNKPLPKPLDEIGIEAHQVFQFKTDYHKNYLKDWLKAIQSPYHIDAFWDIREQCIDALIE